MLIPYQADVPVQRWPIANFVVIGATALFSLLVLFTGTGLGPFALDGWSIRGLISHMFVHGGSIHLIGNMLFLWVFGNAVCAKIGNIQYAIVYLALGVFAAMVHIVADGRIAIGASGAINGVIGMYLVWYPLNNVSCLYFIFFRSGQFELSSFWLILLWLAFDIWGAAAGLGGVAYWAHLGGFIAGFALAVILLRTRVVVMGPDEKSLLEAIRKAR
jgi:membrane associated rhomboid family serine protease